jgi:predicted 3-demethylubiquinone-9 3-methyltransferase (glyoxalase superfamily)
MQKITPFLWFDDNAEEAVNFYVSVFKGSQIGAIKRYGDAGPGPKGSVMLINFQIHGQEFIALNGGPQFKFTEAISFVVDCRDQAEVDELWEKLSDGGEKNVCGWLKDKFGISWQIVPSAFLKLLDSPDYEKSQRAFKAMMKMTKLDIAELQRAYDGE